MAEEKELSAEEEKAKEYVDFYYFWLFNYCARNYLQELNSRATLDYCSPESHNLRIQRERIAKKLYWGHPLSKLAPRFNSIDDCTEVTELLRIAGGVKESAPDALKKLYEDNQLDKWAGIAPSDGLEILGTSGAYISKDGYLRGHIIVKIDLLTPISEITTELSKLKEEKFERFPDFLDSPEIQRYSGTNDYLLQRKVIKEGRKASFAVKDDAARAIGLWFWDAIDGEWAIFNNFADAWKVIQGDRVPYILVGEDTEPKSYSRGENLELPENFEAKMSEAGLSEELRTIVITHASILASTARRMSKEYDKWEGIFIRAMHEKDRAKYGRALEIPSRKVFAKLGYSCSEPSAFRRLYRDTKRCINACEVLSLKN